LGRNSQPPEDEQHRIRAESGAVEGAAAIAAFAAMVAKDRGIVEAHCS
jgi:hypothetical protein